ncbi:hypothetical protein PR048_031007 [Dryococelus australis]|uniref:DDE-1 domain-containing protein n=1 Tax=Dryococelus australis TaxID=614101 RepID=A0ABQ9G592_9NEOP|nr:hypothetical protein PR048_031007 [Dryococelus australis]
MYTVDNVIQAVQDVKDGKLFQRAAVVKVQGSKTIIQERVSGKVTIYTFGSGRHKSLSDKEELNIETCILAGAHFGYPYDRHELLNLVGEYVKANNLKTQFTDDTPGEDCYLAFMKWHPRLSLKKLEHLQKLRMDTTNPNVVYDFFDKFESALTGQEKACFVFNADERGFCSDPSHVRSIGEKGKTLSRVSGGSGRESTTVLACVSVDGYVLPPMVVFKGAAVQARWTSENAYPGTLYSMSTNGWMEEPQFYNWLCACFFLYVTKLRQLRNFPGQAAILTFDGHASHISLRICSEAIKNNVTLICLPSHLTDKLQPLDKCVFGPVKTSWETKLVEHDKNTMGQKSGRLSKYKELSPHTSSNFKPTKSLTSPTLKSVIDIFSEKLRRPSMPTCDPEDQGRETPVKKATLRLKQVRCGAVVTMKDVMKRLEEAEAAKSKKKSTQRETEKRKASAETPWQRGRKLGGARMSTRYTYACCVQEVVYDDDDIVVMSLKRGECASEFSIVENDVFSVSRDQIISIFPEPKLVEKDRKIIFVFPGSVSVFEKP